VSDVCLQCSASKGREVAGEVRARRLTDTGEARGWVVGTGIGAGAGTRPGGGYRGRGRKAVTRG
jgi:hypothetical protein